MKKRRGKPQWVQQSKNYSNYINYLIIKTQKIVKKVEHIIYVRQILLIFIFWFYILRKFDYIINDNKFLLLNWIDYCFII